MDLGARGLDLVVMVMTHVAPSGTVLLQHINMPIHIVHRKAGTRSSGGLLAERETSADRTRFRPQMICYPRRMSLSHHLGYYVR